MDQLKWWQKTAVYQIYPKSFCDSNGDGIGDLNGITGKLDYIRNLGAGAIWLTPVYASPMFDNGYDIADYCSIAPEYGTMADMERLIAEADKRSIRIVMDLVFNHTSDQHSWFKEARASRDSAKRDWYIWADARPDGSPPTNWRGIFGGAAWTWEEETGQYYLHTFAKQQPDLNWENPKVRQALYDAALFWLNKGIGGFRIDAITYIKKPPVFHDLSPDGPDGRGNVHRAVANQPGIVQFIKEFKQAVFAGRDIFTVAEANGVASDELQQWVGPEGAFDMLFEFSHIDLNIGTSGLWCEPVKWKLPQLKKALSESQQATAKNGWYPIFFENHDQPRSINHFFPPKADSQLAAKALATVLYTLRGTPFIYEGQELGLGNIKFASIDEYDDISSKGQYKLALQQQFSPEQALQFVWQFSRDNARTPMQWTAGKNSGFSQGDPWLPVHEDYQEVNAAAEQEQADSVLRYYQALAELRQASPVLLQGSYEELLPADERIYAYRRKLNDRMIVVLVNFSEARVPYNLPEWTGRKKRLLGNYPVPQADVLRSYEAQVYLCERGIGDEAGSN